MRNFYFVIVEEIDGKKIAYSEKVPEWQNIVSRWDSSSVLCVTPIATKRGAEHIANEWNNGFKKNGEFLFL